MTALLALGTSVLSSCAFWDMSDWSSEAGNAGGGPGDGSADASAVTDATDDADGADIPVLARDGFSRSVTGAFGEAEVGGAWQTAGNGEPFAVDGEAGIITVLTPGSGPNAALPAVVSDDVDMQVLIASEKNGGGSGLYVSVIPRRVSGVSTGYIASFVIDADGHVAARMTRVNDEVFERVPNILTLAAGEAFRARVQATGRSPTRLRSKAWKSSQPEPPTWTIDVTDETPSLQAPGAVALNVFLSSTAENAPIAVRFDDLLVRPASRVP